MDQLSQAIWDAAVPLHVPYFEQEPDEPVSHLVWERWQGFGRSWGQVRAKQKMAETLKIGMRWRW